MTTTGAPVRRWRTAPLRRGTLLAGRLLVTLTAFVVFLVTAAGWVATHWLDAQLRHVLALDPNSAAIKDGHVQRGDENILLVGSDSRFGAQHEDHAGDATAVRGARSDAVMVAHLPADRSRLVIVSFPRDLQIQRPPCERWDPVSGRYTGQVDPGAPVAKLNSAYEVGGPLCLTRVVQQLSGLAITRFVGVDFQGFKAVVDAVGGVDVCVGEPLVDEVLGTIIPTAGQHTISGDTALGFVRARFVVDDPTSDYGRIARQQHFLSALLREVLAPDVLLHPNRLHTVVSAATTHAVGENISTTALLDLTRSVRDLRPADVTLVTVPTAGEANEYGNEELRVRDNAALFQAIITGAPLPGEQLPGEQLPGEQLPRGAPPPHVPATSPLTGSIPVRVLNGARIAGAAAATSHALRAAGFRVIETGDSPVQVSATLIRYPPDRTADALALLGVWPGAVPQADQLLTESLVLVVGPDFRAIPLIAAAGANASTASTSASASSSAVAVSAKPARSSPALALPTLSAPLDTVNAADTRCS